jgi:valyl-tRNA synthetase
MQVVARVRGMRAELGLTGKAKLDLFLAAQDAGVRRLLAVQEALIRFLARVESITWGAAPEGARRDLTAGIEIGVLAQAQEPQKMTEEERGRLLKELEKLDADIGRAEERLSNEQYLAKAPAQVVETGRVRLAEMKERRESLRASLGA